MDLCLWWVIKFYSDDYAKPIFCYGVNWLDYHSLSGKSWHEGITNNVTFLLLLPVRAHLQTQHISIVLTNNLIIKFNFMLQQFAGTHLHSTVNAHTHMCVHIHIRILSCIHIHIHIRIHMCTNVCISSCPHAVLHHYLSCMLCISGFLWIVICSTAIDN